MTAGTKFGVTKNGYLFANSGKIANWNVGAIGTGWSETDPNQDYLNSLYSYTDNTNGDNYLTFLRMPSSPTGHVFAVRKKSINDKRETKVESVFAVQKDGKMIAKDADISGIINAT
jgi:hypothetical protein